VREEILRMSREDAEERAALADVLPGTPDFDAAIGRLTEGDRKRAQRVGELIAQRGLPLPDAVGEEAAAAFLALVLRGAVPPSVQDGVLGALEQGYRDGRVGGNRLATFTDQLRMMRDQPQVYGTQLLLDLETGFLRPYPIEDEGAVDERRREVGLGPFGDYLRRMRARVEGA
jgi:hypothetical protein